ncbi:MAG: hypothetical protein A2Y00_06965 [Omnitrophica WOR_2 bacterium GWF2_43_52]|nr:MAG: hypothetical protein A2062_05230 [Omnitrophica WOR_2 bacterium GWA2_44_7]OGX14011.1 MAG: hypothetical protein A2Y01_05250 [Omnitrophica WOR_2 bacterium GWC2_44_8]OGX20162.1 MAG: hypothetical protein A2Y00_06965 [Omnitrophica WOR_2 bacterium GWF2_43_52]OGX53316.1 MAG: hypothetical protein A2460_04070 [Omnitrophica WOR_2 bacterium RIFOXYC2_FULL_43_9]HAH19287.1 hypothetical protein [Candidatus Omnitrophota bacterium]
MAGKQEIELFISDDGELKVHIKGMKGPGCLKVLETLAKEIGSEKGRTLTSEYYESTKNTNTTSTKLKK